MTEGGPCVIDLSPAQIEAAKSIAARRQAANEKRRRVTLKMAERESDAGIHVDGAIGEVGFALFMGQHRLRCAVHDGRGFRDATGGPDVAGFEVKATRRPHGRLLVPVHLEHKHKPDTRYALVRLLKNNAVEVVGWAWGHEFVGKPECIDLRLPKPAYTPATLHWFA